MPRVFADLTPLRESPDFRRLWFGQLISFSGSQMSAVAIPLQVFLITHSSLAVGLTSIAQLVPLIIGSFTGGALADARDRRALILWSNIGMAATSLGLAANAGLRHPHLWLVVVLSALTAGFSGVFGPARGAILPTLVSKELYAASAALWQIVMQVGIVVGPAIAGLLIGAFSLRTVYVIDAITFTAAIIGALRMAPAPAPEVENPLGLIRSAADGFRYLRTAQAVQGTFAADLVAMIFGMPRALFPALGLGRLGGSAATVGLLYAAPGAGGLIGAATTGSVGRIHRQGRAVVISIVLWGIAIAGFGLSTSLPLALVFLAVAGAADVWSAVFRNTILQNFVADSYRGRLNSIHILVVTGGPRVGDLESGTIAAAIGAQGSVITGGLACVVGILIVAKLMPTFTNAVATPSVDGA